MAQSSAKPVVIITGASAGIGDAIARRFAKGGWNIVAVRRRKKERPCVACVADLAGIAEVAIVAGDVTDPETPKQAVQTAMEKFGRLDCLVNNAGSGKWAPVKDTDDATLDEVIDTSLKAPFRFARAALGAMGPGLVHHQYWLGIRHYQRYGRRRLFDGKSRLDRNDASVGRRLRRSGYSRQFSRAGRDPHRHDRRVLGEQLFSTHQSRSDAV